MNSEYAKYWPLDPGVIFLNHGSFGSCPLPILEFQHRLQMRLERQPVQFLVRELEGMWDEARATVAQFVGAKADDLVFVTNATSGVNTVLRSLTFAPGDELLVTDHEYNACRNALDYVAARCGAKVVVAAVPFPLSATKQIVDTILERVTPRTRLALIDHVTSQTGLVMPIAPIVAGLKERGVETLVDGAHGPGMVPVDLAKLGAAYYTANCHKWLCGPKTAGILHVRPDRQREIHPLSISHGLNSQRTDRSRFLLEFGWMGTQDPTPFLAVPKVLEFLAKLIPGGWPEIMRRNRALALEARDVLCQTLKIPPPCPDECIGSMAALPVPDALQQGSPAVYSSLDALQEQLWKLHRIEVPVVAWPEFPKRLLRVSAQLYNSPEQYTALAKALAVILNLH